MSGAYRRCHLHRPPCHWEHKLEQSYGIAAWKNVGHCDFFTHSSTNTEHIENIETQIYLKVFSVITAQYQYNGINPRLIS